MDPSWERVSQESHILFTFQRVVSAECQAPDAVAAGAAREQRRGDGGQRPSYPGFEQRSYAKKTCYSYAAMRKK